MCGIAGVVATSSADAMAARMSECLAHRGPNSDGLWVSKCGSVAMAHRRLSIHDLSPTGAQPMVSQCGRFVLVYNGEVYNFHDLREQLISVGFHFEGGSDTEVLLAAIVNLGVEAAAKSLNGMFSFAVFDTKTGRMSLVRDRIGIKPLYYGWIRGQFFFASEIRAIRNAVPDLSIDRDGLRFYMVRGYVPAPLTIFEGVKKLLPGEIYSFYASLPLTSESGTVSRYWELPRPSQWEGDEDQYQTELDSRIRRSVELRMLADVPVGAFLSGGVDSSLIVSYMRQLSSQPVRTYSIGFSEADYDESGYAGAVAAALGTKHTNMNLSPNEALSMMREFSNFVDEPFGDSSQLPMLLVSKLARNDVTVALSGDGGDELFCGYRTYSHVIRLWQWLSILPQSLRRSIGAVTNSTVRSLPIPSKYCVAANKLVKVLDARDQFDVYSQLLSATTVDVVKTENVNCKTPFDEPRFDLLRWMQRVDMLSYLPDDILTKVDRSSMRYGLEARVPLLDHNVVELAMQCPSSLSYNDGKGKEVLKRLLSNFLPRELFDRKKKGFAVPMAHWLRGPLRPWVEEMIDNAATNGEDLFHSPELRSHWEQHLSEKADWSNLIWNFGVFQNWYATKLVPQKTIVGANG